MEAAVDIGQRLDGLAGTGGGQREAQAKWRDDALASAKLDVFATGVEQRFGKHPLELVSDHAKLSVIHRGLLSLSYKQHIQEEFRMDHHKNQQQNQKTNKELQCGRTKKKKKQKQKKKQNKSKQNK